MKMRFLLLYIFLALSPARSFAESKAPPGVMGKGNFALLLNFEDITALTSPYDDGLQTGVGLKYWLTDKWSMRALLSVLVEPYEFSDTSEATLGFSAAGEFHPRSGAISPYFGGLFSCQFNYDGSDWFQAYALGGIGGVEVALFQNFALYVEYQAMCVYDRNGFGFKLGNTAILGFEVYF